MADLTYKIEEEVVITENAGDFFHDILLNRPDHVSNVHPELVQGCDLHEGEFGTIGSIIAWDYTLDGKPQTLKQEIMEVDEKNKMMKFKVVGGELADEYPIIYCTFKVTPKDNESSIVKWIFEYEKKEADGRDPTKEMHALIELTKKIDDHHRELN